MQRMHIQLYPIEQVFNYIMFVLNLIAMIESDAILLSQFPQLKTVQFQNETWS